MTTYVALDIETAGIEVTSEVKDEIWSWCNKVDPPGNMKKPETIEKWRAALYDKEVSRRGLHPGTGRVIVASLARLDRGSVGDLVFPEWSFNCLYPDDEFELLSAIDSYMCTINPQRIYTFNGTNFDLWFLMWRYCANAIAPKFHWPFTKHNKLHCDLMEYTKMGKGGLDFWLTGVMGLSKEGSGSQVQELYDAGRIDDIVTYSQDEMKKLCMFIDRLGTVFPNGMPERFYS